MTRTKPGDLRFLNRSTPLVKSFDMSLLTIGDMVAFGRGSRNQDLGHEKYTCSEGSMALVVQRQPVSYTTLAIVLVVIGGQIGWLSEFDLYGGDT